MSLCRYLPAPSDRMGIIWTLLSVKGAAVLEYGPAGTTHFSVGMYGKMGVEPNMSLFTTHLSEDDVIMGDVKRLEDAIKEIDKGYSPEVLFVVASSVTSVIGTDIKGVCNYMQEEVNTRLIPVDTGGFKGDYSLGMKNGYDLIVKTFATQQADKKEKTYNILGASGYSYRMKSDLWELKSLMKDSFDYDLNAVLGFESDTEQLKNLSAASINLVLRKEALDTAKYLEEKFGIPYVYGIPYGYQGTLSWLTEISKVCGTEISKEVTSVIRTRMMESAGYKMYSAMYMQKGLFPNGVVIGDYDQIKGFSSLLDEIGLPVELKICNHSIAGIEDKDIVKMSKEKDKIEALKNVNNAVVFGDEISLHMCNDTCEKVVTAFPLVYHTQIAKHLPFVGIKGMDYILESIDRYFGRM